MKRIIYLMVIAFALSSCVVKPYTTPSGEELNLEDSFRNLTDTSGDLAQTPWRDIFVDEHLQALIDTVLAGNIDMQQALLRVDQAYSMLRSSRAQIAPSIGVGASYGGAVYLDGKTSYADELDVSLLSWEIDLWGKLYANKEASKAQFWQTQEAAKATRQSLIAATATAFYNLSALESKKDVIIEAISNRTEYLATTLDLKESGKVNEVAVQQAVAQLAEVQAALPSINMSIELAENSLALLAGRTEISFKRKNLKEGVCEVSHLETGTPVQLLSYRSDVREAEMNYRSKHYLFMASRAALYPSLTIGASYSLVDVFSAQTSILGTLAGLTAPIFNGRKLRSAKESAEAEANIARLEFQKTVFTAIREVNDAVISIRSYDSIVTHQTVQLKALEKAYEYSGDLFLSGYANYLDVLVAQTSVYNLQQAIIDSYLGTLTSRIELYRALGGGSDEGDIIPQAVVKNDPAVTKKAKKSKNTKK
ncbi:MAG: TolC family protein [Rikenellaceae bacterium]